MLGLTLREEFRGKRLKGTAIELSNDNKTGATQVAASEFLEITYPTSDMLMGASVQRRWPCRADQSQGARGQAQADQSAAGQSSGESRTGTDLCD